MSDEKLKQRTELEVNFAEKLDAIIDQLVYSNFSDEDTATFSTTLKTFLKFDDIKEYILDLLYSKVVEVSKIIKPHDQARFASFRKLVSIILDINDDLLIDSLETYLARNRKEDHFFIFLEEKVKKGIPYEKTEKVFIELMGLNQFNIGAVGKYLEIIGKDKYYIIKRLSSKEYAKNHITLRRYINELMQESVKNENDNSFATQVIPALLKEYEGDIIHYLETVRDIIVFKSEFTYTLLHDGGFNCHETFWKFVVAHYSYNVKLIKSFSDYLEKYFPDQLSSFEDDYLNVADCSHLVDYAVNVSTSSKRKVLRQIVKQKCEAHLISFIRYFPEYRSLLPLL